MSTAGSRGPGAAAPGPRAVRYGGLEPRTWWLVVPALLAVLGLLVVQSRTGAAARAADLRADLGAGPTVQVAAVPQEAEPPVALVVPALGLDTLLDGIDTDPEGALQVPEDPARAGWYVDGPAPGDRGPAVLAGHLDSRAGPGIFAGLEKLREGDPISVRRADGTFADFAVDEVTTYAKRDFPTQRVYVGDGTSTLRIITCGGDYDADTGRYRSNTIVFATLTGVRNP